MLKNIAKLEVVVGDKVGQFLLDNDTPIPAVKEMLFQLQKYIAYIEDQVKLEQERREKEKPPLKEEGKNVSDISPA